MDSHHPLYLMHSKCYFTTQRKAILLKSTIGTPYPRLLLFILMQLLQIIHPTLLKNIKKRTSQQYQHRIHQNRRTCLLKSHSLTWSIHLSHPINLQKRSLPTNCLPKITLRREASLICKRLNAVNWQTSLRKIH